MLKRIVTCVLLCLVMVFSSYSSHASTQDSSKNKALNDKLNALFNIPVFSVSKKLEDSFDTPAAIYVITSEDIRRSGVNSIPEALRIAPGLQVTRQGAHKWAISSRGFNFQFSNKLLILIDGRTVYTTAFSGAFWDTQDLVLEDIEKIEVIRGPGATIWGTNAVNGVINIITKNAGATQGTYVSGLYGNKEQGTIEARHGKKLSEDSFFRVYAKHFERDGEKEVSGGGAQDDWRGSRAGFRYDINDRQHHSFSLHGDIHRGEAENYFSFLPSLTAPFQVVDRNDKESTSANIVARWEHQRSPNSNISLQAFLNYDHFDMQILKRSETIVDVDFQHVLNTHPHNQFIWGVGYRHVMDKVNDSIYLNYELSKRNDSTYSAFLQNKWGIVPGLIDITLGSKFEHNDITGSEMQPSIKMAAYPSDNQTIWAAISRAVRTPNRGERGLIALGPVGLPIGQFVAIDSSDTTIFKSEELTAYELGYRIRPRNNLLFDATLFYNDYSNLRTFQPGPGIPSENIAGTVFVVNGGYGETYGLEMNSRYQATPNWRLEAVLSYLKMTLHLKDWANDANFHKTEGESPKVQFSLRSYANLPYNLELDNMLYYVDDLAAAGNGGIDGYVRFDTRLGWRPYNHFEISLVGKNLFEKCHQEFNAALYSPLTETCRSVYVKLTWDLN